MLSLRWEHNFGRSDPPKIDPESDSERHQQEKLSKIASGAVSGRTFSLPGPFLVDFRVPARAKNRPKTVPCKSHDVCWSGQKLIFLNFLRSGVFRKGPGAILEAPGTLPDQILRRFFTKLYDVSYQIPVGFCDTFLTVASGSCRGLSGFAGVLPGSASNLSNPLCGVPLGYGEAV